MNLLTRWLIILLLTLVTGVGTGALFGQGIYGNRTVEGSINYCADAGNTDDYSCALSPAINTYVTGACYRFKANTANTGAATIDFGPGPKTIVKVTNTVSTALANSDIRAGQVVNVCYDGTNMQMSSMLGNTATADPDTVTSAATLTSGLPIVGNGSKSVTTANRSGNTSEYATIAGTKTTNKQLAFDASGNVIATATDIGGGGGGGETASTSLILYNGLMQGSTTPSQVTGLVNQGICNLIHVPHKASWTQAAFKVTTQSGTCGGTCGFQIGVYSMPGRSVLAKTEVGTSDNATSTKDININGWKFLTWSSGTQVTANVLTLDSGSYLTCYTTDSTALYINMKFQPAYLYTENEFSTAKHGFNAHGYQASFSTGSGGSIALPASWSGNLTAAGSGENHAQIFFVP